MFKGQISSRIFGGFIFILGSILFWFLLSKNNNEEVALILKKTFFIGIFCVIGLVVFQDLARRISKSQTPKQKVSFTLLFLIASIILFLLIYFFMKF